MRQDLTIRIGFDAAISGPEPDATTSTTYRIVQRNFPERALELINGTAEQQHGYIDVGTIELGTHGISVHSRVDYLRLESSQDHKLSQIANCDDGRVLMSDSSLAPLNVPRLEFRIADETPTGKVQVNSSLPGGVSTEPGTSQMNDELQANFQDELNRYQTETSLSLEENSRANHDTRSSPPLTPKQHRELVKDTPATGTRFKQLDQSAEVDAEATGDEDEVASAMPLGSVQSRGESSLENGTISVDHEDGSSIHDFSKKDGTLEISLDAELYAKDENWTPEPSTALPLQGFNETGLDVEHSSHMAGDMQESTSRSDAEKHAEKPNPVSPGPPTHAESTGTEKFSTPDEGPDNNPRNDVAIPTEKTPRMARKRGRKRKTSETREDDIVDNGQEHVASPKRLKTSSQSSHDFTSLNSPMSARNVKKYNKESTIREDEPATPEETLLDPPIIVFSNSMVADDIAIKKWLRASKATVEKNIDGNNFDVLVVSRGEVRRTSKLLMAVALGKRVVTDDWLIASHKAQAILSPDPYIISKQEHWSYDPTDLHRRSSLLSGCTLHITSTLKKEYGDGYKDIETLAKTVGASKVISRKVAKKGDNEGVVFMAKDKTDPEVDAIHARGASCFNKEFLPMSVLRGEADLENEEFMIR